MNELRKIAYKVILLIWDVLVFTYQIVRKIILPNRRRKGNILSSLLSLFVGLMERILSFEKSILRQPVVFTHKYVRQALVIAAAFLFLISSFEWTVDQHPVSPIDEMQAVAVDEPAAKGSTIITSQQFTTSVSVPAGKFLAPGRVFSPTQPSLSEGSVTTKKYLRFGVFRI